MKSTVDIIVVSNKTEDELAPQICEIEGYLDSLKFEVKNLIKTCLPVSASINRNYGLLQAESEFVIMIDDDIFGFKHGWIDDMIVPLLSVDHVINSSRLVTPSGEKAIMQGDYRTQDVIQTVPVLPTATIAFRGELVKSLPRLNGREHRQVFNEEYIGSGFEDTQFFIEFCTTFQNSRLTINNNVKLIHTNEMKNQRGKFWEHNKLLFNRWWTNFYKENGDKIPEVLRGLPGVANA